MEAIASYSSEYSSEDDENPASKPLTHLISLSSAKLQAPNPQAPTKTPTLNTSQQQISNSTSASAGITPTGHVAITHVSDEAFESQLHSFSRSGEGVDPGRNVLIVRKDKGEGKDVMAMARKRVRSVSKDGGKRLRGDNDEKKKKQKKKRDSEVVVPTSRFCLGEEYEKDWKGRSWVEPHGDWKTFEEMEKYTAYVPKRCTGGFEAHKGGVSAMKLFPKYGHLLLSGGMDKMVKIWDTVDHRKCMRVYEGHGKTVKDVDFSGDGRRFLSGGFDGSVKLWDTESGRVLGSYSCDGAIPHCVKFCPGVGQENEFMIGRSDKKMVQMDVRDARTVVQEYKEHMGAVNCVTFVDGNRRIVSSCGDKILRVWDYGIPVVIKYISDPTLHSMPVVKVHPNQKWMACQSLDNQILLFGARDKFKLNKKRRFAGHSVSGYACGLTFSADGRFIGSGDALGRVFFWDWKTSRLLRALQGHKGVCIGVEWHPTEASKVVSCGWDGQIKYWD